MDKNEQSRLVVKHCDCFGWAVFVDGFRLTDWRNIKSLAEHDKELIIRKRRADEKAWAEKVKEAHREEDRAKAWIKLLEKKYHAKRFRGEKIVYYDKQQAMSMAMKGGKKNEV